MALKVFKNYPDTSTPANAENLTYNFNELNNTKINKTDIINNLTSIDEDKPLSANQGKVLNDIFNNMKTINLTNRWLFAQSASGGGLSLLIPLFNPTNQKPTINITSAEIYNPSSGWQNLSGISMPYFNKTYGILIFNTIPFSMTSGYSYLIRMIGTITCN